MTGMFASVVVVRSDAEMTLDEKFLGYVTERGNQ
jgi:hypothetical protein